MPRHDGRRPDQLRELDLQPDFLEQPHGSILYAQGRTVVLCTATVEEEIPRWLRGKGRGWMTAEYSLLPASTGERTQRAASRGRPDGRTVEIQRLIAARAPEEEIREAAVRAGMTTLAADGLRKAAEGITALAEVARILPDSS